MSAMSLATLVNDTGGHLTGDALFSRVSTDTRSIQAGDLYVALSGKNFDGNQFVSAAFERGAAAAIVTRAPEVDIPNINVDDARRALGAIARNNRRQFKGPVVALTGSAGKTSCKEMVSTILQQLGPVLATRGNLNNEIGVPQTLLAIDAQHKYAVVEMGASRQGDISYLCQFAEPDVVLVTNAMPAHMESFGSLQTVAATKGEIFESSSPTSVAVINLDDQFAGQWREQAGERRVVAFSVSDYSADVCAKNINSTAKGLRFLLCYRGEELTVSLALLGRHNVANALAASAACFALGVSISDVRKGLETVKAVPGRLKLLPGKRGITLIDDSYNANPGAVKAAVDVLAEFGDASCLVLGTMAELGEQAEALHREVGRYTREAGINRLLAVGEWADAVVDGFGEGASGFDDMKALLAACEENTEASVVLVKGSRSAGMERVVELLKLAEGVE